jgi:hypothetical protein
VKPSGTSRALALSIVIAGILTFFYPFITTDPPVGSVTRWSCFDIVLQMYNGVLPPPICERCGEPIVRTLLALPFMVTVEYALLIAALLALSSTRPAKAIRGIVLFGVYAFFRGEWGTGTRMEFERTFFGLRRRGHVHYSGLLVTQLIVMAILFLASLDLRDEESAREARPGSRFPLEPRQPEVIDAEIVREDKEGGDARHNPPRLPD